MDLVSSGRIPKSLPLGSDAVQIIRNELSCRLEEVDEWETYSVMIDY